MIYDHRVCSLGEGPLWHPLRAALFWFDINAKTLHSTLEGTAQSWTFERTVSAAGWVDQDTLLVASEVGLHRFDIATGALSEALIALEADNALTRSNDGRADPWGGFWIGTMGYNAERGAGAIYRFHQGALSTIASDITISNAICFTPDRRFAQYTDTANKQIMRVALDAQTGAPMGEAQVWLDLTEAGLSPDGAVMDADGIFWVACWGAGAVVGFDDAGREVARHTVPGLHTTCPAFGGADLRDLYITSATEGLDPPLGKLGDLGENGKTFMIKDVAQGQQEHQVLL